MRLQRILLALLASTSACSTAARAEPDAEPEHAAGSDTGDAEAHEEQEGGTDEGAHEPAELEAAREHVDAALKVAIDRGEADRLAIAQQRNELTALQTELDARLAGISKLEGKIDELLGAGKVAQDRRRERTDLLATLIASMSPQAAATVLAQMSDAEAQDLLFSVAQTDKRRAAKLIATMPPPRAAAIGQRYLSRDPKAVDESAASAPAEPAAEPAPDPAPATKPAAEPTAPAAPASPPPATDDAADGGSP